MMTMTIHNIPADPEIFNGAIREAIARRNQWLKPITVWMYLGGGQIGFEPRAATVPPGNPNDERFMELSADSLEELAGVMDDPQAFDGLVTDLLNEQIARLD